MIQRPSRRKPSSAAAVMTNSAMRVLGAVIGNRRMRLKSVNPLLPPKPVLLRKNSSMNAYVIAWVMTYAFMLLFFRNNTGFGGNNGFTDFKRILGFAIASPRTKVALYALSATALLGA